ncbi:acetyl-CoA carboxylase biotin carboxyl carrier protein [Vagococcus zengguangii]|uniref:Biotin carboxyl carrier protein of acetyl-CoA carboxylase n=1 Tax=Vagococcus zengguangii TaxID=2571750 RepID=A0A4D7CPF3_9ENTE|nr:acetyl-CoA carboxylase biotin carboxyl carrier protein [Vagococcus zengguangii]QCI85995.1 acetyl-CoA carboxylase biotin carboxyl carrier protein [Vagococcus zengguangii]TLG80260.1 acetyl-CoA carboxylase biotin carboxyl carrier protein [Vagococcus zengguangii]
MNFSELKELLAQFDESSVRYIDLSNGDFHLVLNKDKAEFVAAAQNIASQAIATTPMEEKTVVETVSTAPVVERVVEEIDAASNTGHEITSPLVGVIYLKPAPDQPEFKQVGDQVKKGDVLCIVEAMKVMNEIVSDRDGVIGSVLVANESVVEYGQSLFTIQ